MNKKFSWKGKKVLITGHTGFKGSWLTLLLKYQEANIFGLSNDIPTRPSIFQKVGITQILREDKREDINNIASCFKKNKSFDCVFHLAAQPMVLESYNNPLYTYKTNTLGTASLLEFLSSLHRPPKVIVIVTTDKVYQNREWSCPYRESDRLGGSDPYSASKSAAEIISTSYFESRLKFKGSSVITVRAGNIIGPGDYGKYRLIPDIIRSINRKKPIILRYPNAIRPWQFILDPLNGYLKIAEKFFLFPKPAMDSFNFGPTNSSLKVKEIVNYFYKNYKHFEVEYMQSPQKETLSLQLESQKAISFLNWKPSFNIERSLDEIIKFEKTNNKKEYCINLLKDFYAKTA